MGYIKMAKKAKAKLSGKSETGKKKKKPVRSWLKKMFDKLKARKAKRKLDKARNDDSVRTREPNTDRVSEPRDNVIDKITAAAKDGVKNAVNANKVTDSDVIETSENEEAKKAKEKQKYIIIGVIILIIVILAIVYFVTKKK